MLAEGRSQVEISREVGYGAAYWSRLKHESPLFEERIEFYRQTEERAWLNARYVNYNAIGDYLEERFLVKLQRRKRRLGHNRALIRSVADMLKENDELRPLAAMMAAPSPVVGAASRSSAPRVTREEIAAIEAKQQRLIRELEQARREAAFAVEDEFEFSAAPQPEQPRLQDATGMSGSATPSGRRPVIGTSRQTGGCSFWCSGSRC